MQSRTRLLVVLSLALVAGMLVPVHSFAQTEEEVESFNSDNMSHVANLPYEIKYPDVETLPYGTDIEFATLAVPASQPPPGEPTDPPVPTDPPDPGDPGGPGDPGDPGSESRVQRVSGNDRVTTAAAVSAATFDGADTVVVATASDYADALAGAPLAANETAPLLLSDGDRLSDATAQEIARLEASEAVLLGGTAALSTAVEDDLRDAGLSTRRIGGSNRFATAALVADELPEANEVFVVEGEHAQAERGWPDALSAAAITAAQRLPILLVNAERLPAETADALSTDVDVTIVGGTAAVSPAVADELDREAATVTRIGGANRYATSALVTAEALDRGADPATTYVAAGTDFADGLVAGAAVGADNGMFVLIDGQDLDASPDSATLLDEQAEAIETLVMVGGPSAISAETEERLREILGAQSEGSDSSDEGATLAQATELHEFAIAGSEFNGMQIVDITDPENPEITGVYDCGTLQGDIQIFKRGDRTYATFTSEDTSSIVVESQCVQDAVARGQIVFEDSDGNGQINGYGEKTPAFGTYIADITDPANPVSAGFVQIPEGSHNNTVHPSGMFFYNSNAQLAAERLPKIEIYDISDLTAPEKIKDFPLPPAAPGLSSESHDVTFSADGTRAYSAALSNTVIINTEDPANPSIISFFEDPAINVEHQADPITMTDDEGNEREFLLVEDELAGAAGNGFCPGGGVHVYDITGELEQTPLKVGVFFIPEFRPAGPGTGTESLTCTAHVYRLYPEQGLMTIAWYNAGVWVVDLSELANEATTPASQPMEAVGFFFFENSDTWSFKTNKFEADGSFYGYGNDIARGFDVYRYEPPAPGDMDPEFAGEWLSPSEALARAQANPVAPLSVDNPLRCLLPRGTAPA